MLNRPRRSIRTSVLHLIEDIGETVFDLLEVDDTEELHDKLTMQYSGMKGDLQRVIHQAHRKSSKTVDLLPKNYLELKRRLLSGDNKDIIYNDNDDCCVNIINSSSIELYNIRKQGEIRSFERTLRSSSHPFLSKLNASIQQSDDKSSARNYDEFMTYCQSQPELKELTLDKDLSRMNYTVHTPQGAKLVDPAQIKSFVMDSNSNAETITPEMAEQHELLYRAANQSIFADMIQGLTSFDGLIRPQLCAGTFVDDCSITIDLASDKPHVRAECYLNISIPDGVDGHLNMAGAIAQIYFCPSDRVLKAEILYLGPCTELTEQQVKQAAKSIAETC